MVCDSPFPLIEARKEEKNAIIVVQLNQRRVLPGFTHCQGRMWEGATVDRFGITGPRRLEPDPRACLGHPSPPMHCSYCLYGQQ